MLLGPLRAQALMRWIWHFSKGTLQPSQVQQGFSASKARRCLAVVKRWKRKTSSGPCSQLTATMIPLSSKAFHQLRAGHRRATRCPDDELLAVLLRIAFEQLGIVIELQGHQPVPAPARGFDRCALLFRRGSVSEVGVVGEEHGGVDRRGAEGD